MELGEKLESCEITHDDKARRVLNISTLVPNVDITKLVEGVTIEELEVLNVPVLQYQTQITIHGIFPDIAEIYLSRGLILNGNKSLGVRYSNIDKNKKETLASISRFSKATDKWHVHIDSTSCEVMKSFYRTENNTLAELRLQAIECYNNTDDSLYIGSKAVYAYAYGMGYAVVINVGAIYAIDVFTFGKRYFGIGSLEYYRNMQAYEVEQEANQAKWKAERDIVLAEEGRKREITVKNLEDAGLKLATGITNGYYLNPLRDGKINVILVERKSIAYIQTYDTLGECIRFEKSRYGQGKRFEAKNFLGKVYDWNNKAKSPDNNSITESIPCDGDCIVTYDRDWTWVKYNSKPSADVLEKLRSMGGRFSGKKTAWYFNKHIESKEFGG